MRKNTGLTLGLVAIAAMTSLLAQPASAARPRTYAIPEPLAAADGTEGDVIAVAADEVISPSDPMATPEPIGSGTLDDSSVYGSCCQPCCGCCKPCCCCPPLWTARFGAIFLQREHGQDGLSMGTGSGYEIDVIRNLGCSCTAVEARYFGLYGWHARTNIGGGPDGTVPLPLTMESQLQSAELNVRRRTASWLQLLAGFRWIELDDTLSLVVPPAVGIGGLNAFTFNRLFGGQIGADAAIFQRGRLGVDAIGKAGIYGNAADGRLTSVLIAPLTGTRAQTAFVGEIGLTTRYALSNCLALRATYELLWLDGVAAVNELGFNGTVANPTSLFVTTNTIFYQGAFVGFEYRH